MQSGFAISGAFRGLKTVLPFEKFCKITDSKVNELILKSHVQWTDVCELQPVVKVRGNAGERRSWAPKNCWRAFPGPTQSLMVQAG